MKKIELVTVHGSEEAEHLKELRRQAAKAIIRFISNEKKLDSSTAIEELARECAVSVETITLSWLRNGIPQCYVKAVIRYLNSIHSVKWGGYQVRPTIRELKCQPLMTESELKKIYKIAS